MSITEKRLDEIRERLDAAEYPDHEHLTICGREGTKVVWVEQSSVDGSVMAGGSVAEVDAGPRTAEMFLNAPQDLADLLAEVGRLRGVLAKARAVTEDKVEKGGVAANDVGWTCYGGAHEPGSYHECPECKKVSDQLARCVLTAALGGGEDA